MKFSVVAKATDGSEIKRTIDAPSRFAVYELMEKEGATVLMVTDAKKGMQLGSLKNLSFGGKVKMEQKITFTKNLAAMIGAGLTLTRALAVIERQTANQTLKKIVADLAAEVKKGSSFHEALARHPKVFSELFIAMTKAGEESGTLADSLAVVARQMDKAHALQKKIKGAMIYPSIILVAILIIAVLMFIYVVPTLSNTFKELGAELPMATQIIISVSDFMASNAILTLGILASVIGGTILFLRSKVGSLALLTVSLRLPVIGELVRETMSARAARALSSLLSSGVEMLSALKIAGEVVGDNQFGKVVREAEERVRKGEALSVSFVEHSKLYPVFVGEMIAVGEETGKVSDMLGQVATYYENDVEERTKDLSTIIEPILMIFIGGAVGVFAMAMITPIYSLSDKI